MCVVWLTWLRGDNEPAIANLKQEGYNVISCPRIDKKGGGLALISKMNKYNVKKVGTGVYETFEIRNFQYYLFLH